MRIINYPKYFFLMVLLLLSFSAAVIADNSVKLTIVYTEWFPYTYESESGASGFEIEIFKAVLTRMGFESEFRKYPWKRCLHAMQTGQADGLVSMLKNPEREKLYLFPDESISLSRVSLFTKKENPVQYTGDLAELNGRRIGVIMGFTYGDAFDSASGFKKDNCINTDILVRKLIHNRIDIGAENQIVATATAFRMGHSDRFVFLKPPLFTKKLYAVFSRVKGYDDLCRRFSDTLKTFKKSDEYKTIISEYGLSSEFLNE